MEWNVKDIIALLVIIVGVYERFIRRKSDKPKDDQEVIQQLQENQKRSTERETELTELVNSLRDEVASFRDGYYLDEKIVQVGKKPSILSQVFRPITRREAMKRINQHTVIET